MGFPPFQNLSLAFLKDDLQKGRGLSKGRSKKEKKRENVKMPIAVVFMLFLFYKKPSFVCPVLIWQL